MTPDPHILLHNIQFIYTNMIYHASQPLPLQVSHYGGVVVRITWHEGCPWSGAVQAAALAFSQWVGNTVEECS